MQFESNATLGATNRPDATRFLRTDHSSVLLLDISVVKRSTAEQVSVQFPLCLVAHFGSGNQTEYITYLRHTLSVTPSPESLLRPELELTSFFPV